MAARKKKADAVMEELRAFGLGYPGAHLKSPWPGHKDLAVNDKTFAYLSTGEPISISCKLPHSNAVALALPFTKPAEYGLGKSGWVNAVFSPGDTLPVDMLKAWIDESYRAQAPKRLVAALDAANGEGARAPKTKPSAAKRKAPKKATARRRR